MNELTIEQKAELYDKAVEKAKEWHNAPNVDKIPTFGNRIIEDIFPELYESEDERIKNEIIDYISTADDKVLIPYESWIAWLEKQNEQKLIWDKFDELMLKDALEFIETGWSGNGKSYLVYWLKSIKNKFK